MHHKIIGISLSVTMARLVSTVKGRGHEFRLKMTMKINRKTKQETKEMKNIRLLIITILLVLSAPVTAQDEQPEVHTAETRLIYEGVQDLWPYSFLNEKGEPDGFNTELIKLILNKLNIPFDIKIRPRHKVFRDLNDGKADLTIDLTTNFYEGDWHYGQYSITLFTISTLSSKRTPATIRNFHDLSNHKVYVSDSSLCHYLMIDYGWEQNAIPITNMTEAILQMSTDEEGEIVWNTLSLKWMLRKFQIENLEITPVNMPHGECRFISNDEQLLHRLDSVFGELSSLDQLTPLQNKWFYPEREDESTSIWVWYVYGGIAIMVIIFAIYVFFYQLQIKKIMQKNANHNRRLALIMETSGVFIWTYDIQEKTFTWRNEVGQLSYIY
ncbi:MAG: transporter substrate-binding domain-containing protein, partial [Prevotella sp.]|nr:transporter substrate-binding domain-containing protein [Prevotella sp.]